MIGRADFERAQEQPFGGEVGGLGGFVAEDQRLLVADGQQADVPVYLQARP